MFHFNRAEVIGETPVIWKHIHCDLQSIHNTYYVEFREGSFFDINTFQCGLGKEFTSYLTNLHKKAYYVTKKL